MISILRYMLDWPKGLRPGLISVYQLQIQNSISGSGKVRCNFSEYNFPLAHDGSVWMKLCTPAKIIIQNSYVPLAKGKTTLLQGRYQGKGILSYLFGLWLYFGQLCPSILGVSDWGFGVEHWARKDLRANIPALRGWQGGSPGLQQRAPESHTQMQVECGTIIR